MLMFIELWQIVRLEVMFKILFSNYMADLKHLCSNNVIIIEHGALLIACVCVCVFVNVV